MQLQAIRWKRGGKRELGLEHLRHQRAAPVVRKSILSSPDGKSAFRLKDWTYRNRGYELTGAERCERCVRVPVKCPRGLDNSARRIVGAASFLPTMNEIAGPDLRAAVSTSDAYNAMSMLIDKLDRMLRKRTTAMLSRRVNDDIRAHVDLTPAH